jgi:hypothetical protein
VDDIIEHQLSVKLFGSLGKADELKSMHDKSLGAQRYSAGRSCNGRGTIG